MDKTLSKFSAVEIVALRHVAEHYDGWRVNRRFPLVGDHGTIVEVLKAGNRDSYVVECVNPSGITEWLGDFEAEELRPIRDDTGTNREL